MLKKELKAQISLIVSSENIILDEVKNFNKKQLASEREKRLLKINIDAVEWALNNKLIIKDDLKTEKFYYENSTLQTIITTSGLLGSVGVGAISISTLTTGTGLAGALGSGTLAIFATNAGLGTVAVTTTATVLAIAAPIVIVSAGAIYLYTNKKNAKDRIIWKNDFEFAQRKILNYYFDKIDEKYKG